MSQQNRHEIVQFLKGLRDDIIEQFETLEPSHRFQRKNWDHTTGGGGEISLLRGDTFEKAAVNWSGVSGEAFPTNEAKGPFFATGVSLITHMANPHAPTVHFNIRYIETADRHWFGGGYDLTTMGHPYQEDTDHFHHSARKCLEPFGEHLYSEFSKNARNYFYIPHRNKERGIGGIFFDHYNTNNFSYDYAMWKQVGLTFIDAILPIYKRRVNLQFTPADKQKQQEWRAHYVEFNLLYDRGTKFGFSSGGNSEAILCSMPPTATW
jgi:coproporphyrinogen III oxidase